MEPWKVVKRAIRSLLGRKPAPRRHRGRDPLQEIGLAFPSFDPRVVFDVGANIGQSTKSYTSRWPAVRVYAFEPVPDVFAQLQASVAGDSRIECHRLALGSRSGGGTIVLGETETMGHLTTGTESAQELRAGTVRVDIATIDEFSAARAIERINYLKIDTEGADLEVLKGAERVLANQSADFIEAEAGMNPENHLHVPFDEIRRFLEGRGYRLFGLYEQVAEWPTKAPNLRRTNPVFVSQRMIDAAKHARTSKTAER